MLSMIGCVKVSYGFISTIRVHEAAMLIDLNYFCTLWMQKLLPLSKAVRIAKSMSWCPSDPIRNTVICNVRRGY